MGSEMCIRDRFLPALEQPVLLRVTTSSATVQWRRPANDKDAREYRLYARRMAAADECALGAAAREWERVASFPAQGGWVLQRFELRALPTGGKLQPSTEYECMARALSAEGSARDSGVTAFFTEDLRNARLALPDRIPSHTASPMRSRSNSAASTTHASPSAERGRLSAMLSPRPQLLHLEAPAPPRVVLVTSCSLTLLWDAWTPPSPAATGAPAREAGVARGANSCGADGGVGTGGELAAGAPAARHGAIEYLLEINEKQIAHAVAPNGGTDTAGDSAGDDDDVLARCKLDLSDESAWRPVWNGHALGCLLDDLSPQTPYAFRLRALAARAAATPPPHDGLSLIHI